MRYQPDYKTTLIGSFPHKDSTDLVQRIHHQIDIPVWPQLPRRDFRESMYVQYSASLPRVIVDSTNEKITIDTTGDISPELETFYERFLSEDLDYFKLPETYARGYYDLVRVLKETPGSWVKGQVTGPISFGLTVVDQDLRSVLYDELYADVIVKNMAMNARWQVRDLKNYRENVLIFVDEPYMASFGSAFISLSKEQVTTMLDEVFDAIHLEGGLAGVHCCANTDWSVLLGTEVDVLNLDAFGYVGNLGLYPEELRQFLDRGGVIAWGIVPNDTSIYEHPADVLAKQLLRGIDQICQKAQARGVQLQPGDFAGHSLITPSCGLGSTSIEITTQVLDTLVELGDLLGKP